MQELPWSATALHSEGDSIRMTKQQNFANYHVASQQAERLRRDLQSHGFAASMRRDGHLGVRYRSGSGDLERIERILRSSDAKVERCFDTSPANIIPDYRRSIA